MEGQLFSCLKGCRTSHSLAHPYTLFKILNPRNGGERLAQLIAHHRWCDLAVKYRSHLLLCRHCYTEFATKMNNEAYIEAHIATAMTPKEHQAHVRFRVCFAPSSSSASPRPFLEAAIYMCIFDANVELQRRRPLPRLAPVQMFTSWASCKSGNLWRYHSFSSFLDQWGLSISL